MSIYRVIDQESRYIDVEPSQRLVANEEQHICYDVDRGVCVDGQDRVVPYEHWRWGNRRS